MHDKKENKRVRVHIRRSDTAVKDVTSGCIMVTIQSLTERINRIEDDKTSKNPWQTMLGQSIIDVNVGEFITGSQNQGKVTSSKSYSEAAEGFFCSLSIN